MTATAQLYDNGNLVCSWVIPDAPPLQLRRAVQEFAQSPFRHYNIEPVSQTFVLTGRITENVYRYDRD